MLKNKKTLTALLMLTLLDEEVLGLVDGPAQRLLDVLEREGKEALAKTSDVSTYVKVFNAFKDNSFEELLLSYAGDIQLHQLNLGNFPEEVEISISYLDLFERYEAEETMEDIGLPVFHEELKVVRNSETGEDGKETVVEYPFKGLTVEDLKTIYEVSLDVLGDVKISPKYLTVRQYIKWFREN